MFKRIVLAACGAALALSVGAAGAYFTTQVQVAENVVRAGSISLSSEPTSAAVSIDSLAPGSEAERPVSLVNDGSLPVDVVMTAVKKAGVTDFWDALTCKVTCGSTELYRGQVSQLRTSPLRLPAGSRADVRVTVGLPAAAGNDLAGDYAKFSLYIDGEQAH
ncbi:MAG: hypothetical protein HY876_01950 [Coriobacteriales bacterium]|nr:hypothetical protein [Coriobacteriales bacterium]